MFCNSATTDRKDWTSSLSNNNYKHSRIDTVEEFSSTDKKEPNDFCINNEILLCDFYNNDSEKQYISNNFNMLDGTLDRKRFAYVVKTFSYGINEPESSELRNLLQKAVKLENNGQIDDALDLVFEKFDLNLKAGYFAIIDNLIAEIDPQNYTPDVLLTIVTVSYPAHDKFQNWNNFVKNVYNEFKRKNLITEYLNDWFLKLIDD